jgi:hypothetical protein
MRKKCQLPSRLQRCYQVLDDDSQRMFSDSVELRLGSLPEGVGILPQFVPYSSDDILHTAPVQVRPRNRDAERFCPVRLARGGSVLTERETPRSGRRHGAAD